jgi:cell shape-determining protein MreD
MNHAATKLFLLAAAAWLFRAVGPEWYGTWALTTNLLAAVAIQAGLWLRPWGLAVWALLAGVFWDFTTFSPLGHHILVLGGIGFLVRTQRGWWKGASAGEQAAGSVLAAVAFFALDRFLHLLETRTLDWPFALSVSLVLAGLANGVASVLMGWWLEQEDRFPATARSGRRIR